MTKNEFFLSVLLTFLAALLVDIFFKTFRKIINMEWLKENWKWAALGVVVLIVGIPIALYTASKVEDKMQEAKTKKLTEEDKG